MSSVTNSTVYSLTKHHDKAKKHLKKRKAEAVQEKIMEQAEELRDEANNCFATQEQIEIQDQEQQAAVIHECKQDLGEMEALQMITSCISEMSLKYEQLGARFTQKLDQLEEKSHVLNRKFEELQS